MRAARRRPRCRCSRKAPEHDVVIVADEPGEFGDLISYRTWQPRPVAGTQGLVPSAWHAVQEQWGAAQFQNRFQRLAGRPMRALDYTMWAAVRAVGEAATRTRSTELEAIRGYIRSPGFELAAFKGAPLTFRDWDWQLRQPIPLADAKSLVSMSPQAGFLHQRTPLDTLGIDKAEIGLPARRTEPRMKVRSLSAARPRPTRSPPPCGEGEGWGARGRARQLRTTFPPAPRSKPAPPTPLGLRPSRPSPARGREGAAPAAMLWRCALRGSVPCPCRSGRRCRFGVRLERARPHGERARFREAAGDPHLQSRPPAARDPRDADGRYVLVCASDDNRVEVYDAKTYQPVRTLRSGPDPELFVLHPSGNPLYIANEDDNIVTVVDIENNRLIAEVPVGVEPEGMGISPDGKTIVNTSETTNMVHFIDGTTNEMVDNVLVDARPRFAEFTPTARSSGSAPRSAARSASSTRRPASPSVRRRVPDPWRQRGRHPAGRRADHEGRQEGVRRARAGQPRRRRRTARP